MNQQCGYYGKLLCNACVVEVPQMGDRSRQVLAEEGRSVKIVPSSAVVWAFFVVLALGLGAGLYSGLPPWGGLIGGAIVGAIVAAGLANMTQYKQPVYKTVVENVEVGRSRCCLACRQAVEHLQ
jgi:hypothetical protein